MKLLLLDNAIYFHARDVGNLRPIFSLVLEDLFFRIGHPWITSLSSVDGSPFFGTKDRSLGQFVNSRTLREMRAWRPMEAMDFKLLKSFMESMFRDVGRS